MLGVGSVILSSCRKDDLFDTDGELAFSQDTILFDTVFTTVGSVTQQLKIYNPSNRRIKINSVELAGGSSSPFRINLDGVSGTIFRNIELDGSDSLFLFAEVTLGVNGQTYPLVIEDSILFETNGTVQSVRLTVWGQDAYFHVNELVSGTWQNDKPHVLYGTVAVGFPGLDSNQTLTIPAGTMVHGHYNSSLIVYKSQLRVEGQEGNEVHFLSDRLDPYYRDLPGQWNGIYMLQSNDSEIEHAIIENAVTAVRCDTVFTAGTPALTMNKTELRNNTFGGLIGLGSHIVANNCLIADAGSYCAYFGWGGTYQLNHVTMANYYSYGTRQLPSFVLNNYYETQSGFVVRPLTNCTFRNSIVYGGLTEEFGIDTLSGSNDFYFSDFIARTNDVAFSNGTFYGTMYRNSNPGFSDPTEADFTLVPGAFAIGKADGLTSLPNDLNNTPRDASPDAGCYEAQ